MFGLPRDGEGPAVDEHEDNWRSRSLDGSYEGFLEASQIKTSDIEPLAIRGHSSTASFIVGTFANDHDRQLRLARDSNRVREVVIAADDVAPMSVKDLRVRRYFGFDFIEDSGDLLRHDVGRIVAKLAPSIVGIGANDGNGFQILLEGEDMFFVLEQNDAFARCIERELL